MRMAARVVLVVSVVLSGAARVWSEGVTIEIRSTWWGMRGRRTETYTIAQQGGKYYLEGMATINRAGPPQEETYKVGPIDEKEITHLLQALNEPTRTTVQLEDFLSLMAGQPTQEELSKQAPQLVDRLTARPRWVSGQYEAWTEAQKSLLLNKLRDGHAVAEALKSYFSGIGWTDDYPTVSVTITQPD